MRAIWIPKHGGPDVLEVRETPDPEPGPGEARIRVRAAGLNFAEVMARQGMYPDAPKPPCVVGYECAGEIDAVGEGVDAARIGERVVALKRFGAHADLVVVPAEQALRIPESLDFERAAAIPVTYITAYHMLFRVGALRPGATVLVHMAAGGVGIAAAQLARAVEGVTLIGTASASKHDVLREEGYDHTIDYRTEDYVAAVRRLTDGRGVDLVLDALGGKDWKRGYELLAPVGHLIAFGFANMSSGETRSVWNMLKQAVGIPLYTPMRLMNDNRSLSGVNVGHLWTELDMLRGELEEVLRLFEQGKVKPRIDQVFPFAEAAAAHRRISSRQNIGKIVLVP